MLKMLKKTARNTKNAMRILGNYIRNATKSVKNVQKMLKTNAKNAKKKC